MENNSLRNGIWIGVGIIAAAAISYLVYINVNRLTPSAKFTREVNFNLDDNFS